MKTLSPLSSLESAFSYLVRGKFPFPALNTSPMSGAEFLQWLESLETAVNAIIPADGLLVNCSPDGQFDVLEFDGGYDDANELAKDFGDAMRDYRQIRISRAHIARYLLGTDIASRLAF